MTAERSHLVGELNQNAKRIVPVFADRDNAGRRLGRVLAEHNYDSPIVTAIACGGVPVAMPIWEQMKARPSVIPVAKVAFVDSDERFGVGAVGDGTQAVNGELMDFLGMDMESREHFIGNARKVVASKADALRGFTLPPKIDRPVIIIDDAIASGFSALAAIKKVRQLNEKAEITIAAPIIHERAIELIGEQGCSVVGVHISDSPNFIADNFYQDFPAIEPDQARRLLISHART